VYIAVYTRSAECAILADCATREINNLLDDNTPERFESHRPPHTTNLDSDGYSHVFLVYMLFASSSRSRTALHPSRLLDNAGPRTFTGLDTSRRQTRRIIGHKPTSRYQSGQYRRSRIECGGAGDCEWIECNERIFQVVNDKEF